MKTAPLLLVASALGVATLAGACSSSVGSPVADEVASPAPGPAAAQDASAPDASAPDASEPAPDAAPLADGGDGEAPAEHPTFIAQRGASIFTDDFASGALKPNWSVIGGTWKIENQMLVGSSLATERDPNVGHMLPAERAIVQVAFRFTGTGFPGLRFNHKEDADPQHLLAIRIRPPTVQLVEMTGWSTTTTSKVLASGTAKLDPDTTYVAVLEVFDRKIAFSIDGKLVVSGTTVDQSSTPKNHLILAAYGSSVTYDDVKVWTANPL